MYFMTVCAQFVLLIYNYLIILSEKFLMGFDLVLSINCYDYDLYDRSLCNENIYIL